MCAPWSHPWSTSPVGRGGSVSPSGGRCLRTLSSRLRHQRSPTTAHYLGRRRPRRRYGGCIVSSRSRMDRWAGCHSRSSRRFAPLVAEASVSCTRRVAHHVHLVDCLFKLASGRTGGAEFRDPWVGNPLTDHHRAPSLGSTPATGANGALIVARRSSRFVRRATARDYRKRYPRPPTWRRPQRVRPSPDCCSPREPCGRRAVPIVWSGSLHRPAELRDSSRVRLPSSAGVLTSPTASTVAFYGTCPMHVASSHRSTPKRLGQSSASRASSPTCCTRTVAGADAAS